MKALLLFFLPLLCYAGISEDLMRGPLKADEVSYPWLTQAAVKDHDTDHVQLFKKLFELRKVRTLLEFGLGYSTKFFLDHCSKVISVDIITYGYGPEIMQKFLHVYSDYSNWIPIAFFSGYRGWDYSWAPYKHLGSESLYKATSYQHAHRKDYTKIDDFYLVELNAFISNLLKYNKPDVVFIGHAIILRGDFVQLLFDKVPLIIAHNTLNRKLGIAEDLYGLNRVITPENYEEIYFGLQGGTTIWIQKKETFQELTDKLRAYANTL